MKTFAAGLASHYAAPWKTLAQFLSVTRTDGQTFRFCTSDRPVTVGGNEYESGLQVSSLSQSAGLAVNNLEVTILYDERFTKADFLAGLWDDARWDLFEANWKDPTDGTNVIGHYVTGDVKPGELSCVVEMRALSQFLQEPIGIVTSKTCRARFADFPVPIHSARCRLLAADFTVTGTVTGVTSQQVCADTARTEADDWFGEGIVTFTTGENAGISRKVKSYASDTFTFMTPFPFAIGIGDQYSAIAGCRKRRDEDCKTKFNNILNMQAEPDLPGPDQASASPVVDGE